MSAVKPPCMITAADLQPGDVVVGDKGTIGTYNSEKRWDVGAGSLVTRFAHGRDLDPDERLLLLYREPDTPE